MVKILRNLRTPKFCRLDNTSLARRKKKDENNTSLVLSRKMPYENIIQCQNAKSNYVYTLKEIGKHNISF